MCIRDSARIETSSQPVDHDLVDSGLQARGILVIGSQRMPVGDEEKTLVLVLQLNPVAQSTVIVPQMQRAGGTHAREHTFAWGNSTHPCRLPVRNGPEGLTNLIIRGSQPVPTPHRRACPCPLAPRRAGRGPDPRPWSARCRSDRRPESHRAGARGAVSYTHLDVYKRQVIGLPAQRRACMTRT